MSTDRSTHPNVVEYAVQTMIKRGKSPSAAAKDTVKKHHGTENMFFGPGPSTIDAATLEDALWDRLVDFTITGISRIKEGKEHYALDGTLQHFNQKPNIRAELKRRVVEKMGRDPFTNDDVLKETPMARRTARENTPDAEAAGAQYAQDQITSDYFMDWVRGQLLEASRMDPSTVLPLETKSDARVIAHNMLQQLEWDTKRDLRDNEMARLIGVDIVEREMHKAFFQGFDVATVAALGGLANELLEINRGMRGGSVSEARRGGPSTKPWFGRGEGRLEYAIKIDGIENDFPTKPFGRQEEWPHVQWFMQNAKNEWIRAKHASSGTAALKRWIKDVKPSQFYARWDEGDDSIQVWYTPSEGGVSEAPQGRTPRQIQDFKNGFAEGYREGKHGETDVPGRSPSFEYAEGARLGLLAGARRSGEKFEKALSDAVATWTGGGGGVSEARRTARHRLDKGPEDRRRHGITGTAPYERRTAREIHGYNIEVVFNDEGAARKWEREVQRLLPPSVPLISQHALRDGYSLVYGPIELNSYRGLEGRIYSKLGNTVRVRLVQAMYQGLAREGERSSERRRPERAVITKIGPRTATAQVYDNNGHLMSGIQHPADLAYVEKKIAEWFPGIPVEYKEHAPEPRRRTSRRR